VGQDVKEGDVVALVETDKVTVDIKAELDGVIVEQFGAV
jgi:pyruvate/2-oxoglutarate dehydrogenase complex dihydrolipoamide acyltransferase (E2) component